MHPRPYRFPSGSSTAVSILAVGIRRAGLDRRDPRFLLRRFDVSGHAAPAVVGRLNTIDTARNAVACVAGRQLRECALWSVQPKPNQG